MYGIIAESDHKLYIGIMYLNYRICQQDQSSMIRIGIYRNALVDGKLITDNKYYNIKRIDLSDEMKLTCIKLYQNVFYDNEWY